MGCGRARGLRMPARLDDDDRLDPRGGPGRRHELASVLDQLDVEQDRARAGIESEVVQQISEVDVELIADRHDGGKAGRTPGSPVAHPRRNGSRLRYQREVAGRRHPSREARVELGAWQHHAKAIGSDEAQAFGARRLLRRGCRRTGTVSQSGGDDHRGADAACGSGFDDPGDRRRRRGNDGEVGRRRQIFKAGNSPNAVDVRVARVDDMDLTGKSAVSQILQDDAPDRMLARARADHGDRPRGKQAVEAVDRHGPSWGG